MNSNPSRCSDAEGVKRLLREAGAVAVGIAEAASVSPEEADAYAAWIDRGMHGSMDYLARYGDVRSDPRLLLEGAQSVIVAAFPYAGTTDMPTRGGLRWARYALGDDYHDVLRSRLRGVAEQMEGETRVCVDTAPLRERLWAVRAGVGMIGLNNQLIVPGVGSYVLLGTIISTLRLAPDRANEGNCVECGKCLRACPGGALRHEADGRVTLDARRCLSYISIEQRDGNNDTPLPGKRIYGCDTCQEVCPHNRADLLPTPLPELQPREEILALTEADVLALTPEEYARIFRRSAIKRARLAGLQSNARRLSSEKE